MVISKELGEEIRAFIDSPGAGTEFMKALSDFYLGFAFLIEFFALFI